MIVQMFSTVAIAAAAPYILPLRRYMSTSWNKRGGDGLPARVRRDGVDVLARVAVVRLCVHQEPVAEEDENETMMTILRSGYFFAQVSAA